MSDPSRPSLSSPHDIQAGKMRALAVSGHQRAAQLPDVPTFRELGIGFVDETFRLTGGSPDALASMLKVEIAKWSEVAQSASFMAQ